MPRAFIGGWFVALAMLTSSVALAGEAAPSISKVRQFKQAIREYVVRPDDLADYGLQFSAECHASLRRDGERPLVVLIHGFNSKTERNAAFLAALQKADLPCAAFCYPNDHALDASAALLARELKAWRRAHPQRKIAIVAHSMGGLIARACVEDPRLNPGNVERLILVAPPNDGTRLAHFAVGADLCEHFFRLGGGGPVKRLRASIADGLAEATEDLEPDSAFLTTLNRRERNPEVAYTLLLGTGARVTNWEMDLARRLVRFSGRVKCLSEPAARLDSVLADMDEVLAGKGDGVVAVKRGRLPGVEDVVILPFSHVAVTGPATTPAIAAAQAAVLKRLTIASE